MTKPPKLGTVNGFIQTRARIGRKEFFFDGTTKNLTTQALKRGGVAGTKVQARGMGYWQNYVIEATPWDDRANGFWAKEIK